VEENDRRLLLRLGQVQLENAEMRSDGVVRAFLVHPNGQGLGGRPAITHPGLNAAIEYDPDQVGRLVEAGCLEIARVTARPEFFLSVTPDGFDAVGLD